MALSTDRVNGLPDYFEEHRRPEFTTGWVGPLAKEEVYTEKVPAIFVLDAERRVVFFTDDVDEDYEEMRRVLDGLGE